VGFEEQVRVVWRHRFWLLAFSLLAAIAVFVVASLRTSTYTASAVIGVTPGITPGQTVNNDTVAFATKSYERLVSSDSVLTSGAAAAPGTSVEEMRKRIASSSDLTNGTVTVTASDSNADESVKIANAVATATIAQGQKDQQDARTAKITALQKDADALKAQLDGLAADSPDRSRLEGQYQSTVQSISDAQNAPFNTAQLLQSPEVPKSPGGPGSKSLALFAFIAALVLGAEGLVIAARLRRRPSPDGEEQQQTVAPAPVEPVLETERMRVPLVPFDSGLADLVIDSVNEGHRLIGVLGSGDFPATNDATLWLGQQLALSGHATLVVEGDMTHPTMGPRLSLRSQVGLTDVLAGGGSADQKQRQTTVPGLFVLPAGRAVDRADVLVGVDNVQHALSASSCEVVLVSLPPSMAPEDRQRIAGQLHALVTVVRDGRMRARQVRGALAELGDLHNILVGMGLVDVLPSPEIKVMAQPQRAAAKRPPNGDRAPAKADAKTAAALRTKPASEAGETEDAAPDGDPSTEPARDEEPTAETQSESPFAPDSTSEVEPSAGATTERRSEPDAPATSAPRTGVATGGAQPWPTASGPHPPTVVSPRDNGHTNGADGKAEKDSLPGR
jgi:Mrp family chromosome partitioning ATPase/capsular polysaccharide biosynthesis protein